MEVSRGGVFHQAVRKTREEMPGFCFDDDDDDYDDDDDNDDDGSDDVFYIFSNLYLQQGR